MNNYILYKITYTLHKLGFYYYSVKYYISDNHKKGKNLIQNIINYIFIFFKALFKEIKIFNTSSGYLEYLEIPITTKCTLKCKSCSNLIPYYKHPKDIDINIILKSIDIFLKCIKNIVYVRVLRWRTFYINQFKYYFKKTIRKQ